MDASKKISSTCSELPEEVLIEILARLPAKTLIRFTCVCKYWLSLIKSTQFATKHFATRINSLQQNDCHFLVTFNSNFDPTVKFLSYETLEIFANFECRPIDDSLDPIFPVSWNLFGSCNGIICAEVSNIGDVFLLWNPATREVFVPESPRQILQDVGFGFDDKTNDYKIVMFDFMGNAQLYSLRSNSWREIEPVRLFEKGDKVIFAEIDPISNGRMFTWMVYDCSSNGLCLLSYDMVDEVFLETPMLEGVKGCYVCFMQQRCNHLFPALLCFDLVNGDSRAASADVWVLNEYGRTGHWTKERSLAWPEDIILGPPRGLWKNKGILFIGRGRVLTFYNTVTQEMKSLQVPGRQLLGYTESLFSIKSVCQSGELVDSSTKKAFKQPIEPEGSDKCINSKVSRHTLLSL